MTTDADHPKCVFSYEADAEHSCWGELGVYDETTEGDKIMVCEGHADWSLRESLQTNLQRYRRK